MLSVTKITSSCEIDPRVGLSGGFQFRFEHAHLVEQFVGALGFGAVDAADGKADVNHHIVAQTRLRNEVERDLADNAAELDTRGASAVLLLNFENFAWNCETHCLLP